MKKFLILMCALTLVVGMTMSASAELVTITFDEEGISPNCPPQGSGDLITDQYALLGVNWIVGCEDPYSCPTNEVTLGECFNQPFDTGSDNQILWYNSEYSGVKGEIQLDLAADYLAFDYRRPAQARDVYVTLYNGDVEVWTTDPPLIAEGVWNTFEYDGSSGSFDRILMSSTHKFVIDNLEVNTVSMVVDDFEVYTDDADLRENWKGGKDARKPFLEPQSTGETGPDASQCMRVSLKWTKSAKNFGLVQRKYDPYIDLTGMDALHFYVKVAKKIRIKNLKVKLKKYPEGSWSSATVGRSELESGVWKEIWLPRTSFTDTTWGLVSVIQFRILERDPSSDRNTKVYFDDIYFSPDVP